MVRITKLRISYACLYGEHPKCTGHDDTRPQGRTYRCQCGCHKKAPPPR